MIILFREAALTHIHFPFVVSIHKAASALKVAAPKAIRMRWPLLVMLAFAGSLPALAEMTTVLDDQFRRGPTSVGSGANSASGVGTPFPVGMGEWQDVTGNVFFLDASHHLRSNSSSVVLSRPKAETFKDVAVTVSGVYAGGGEVSQYGFFSRVGAGGGLGFQFNFLYGSWELHDLSNNAIVPGVGTSGNFSPTTGHTYKVEYSLSGSFPTAWTFKMTDEQTSIAMVSASGTTAAGPAAAGYFSLRFGFGGYVNALSRIKIDANTPVVVPVIASSPPLNGMVGDAFSYRIMASGYPISYAASGLPAGLNVDPATGLISGKPDRAGTANVTISAVNSRGSDSKTVVIMVAPQNPPAISSARTTFANVGSLFSYQITGSNNPTRFAATGLPNTFSLNTSTGMITGAPTATGVSSVTITATNSGGSDTETLVITTEAPLATVYGPTGTHWPSLIPTPTLYQPTPNDVEVACTWGAIGAALSALTDAQVNAGARILVQPGTLVSAGFGVRDLQNLGSTAWTRRVTICPRDGFGTVNISSQAVLYRVYGICLAGFYLNNILTYGCSHSAIAWCKVDSYCAWNGDPGIITEKVEWTEVVAFTQQVNSGDYADIYCNGGDITNFRIDGCYFAPHYFNPQDSDPHTDTLQIEAVNGGSLSNITVRDTALFASNNACIQIGHGVDGVVFRHCYLVAGAPSKARYPVPAGGSGAAGQYIFNGNGKNLEAYDSVFIGEMAIGTDDAVQPWSVAQNTRTSYVYDRYRQPVRGAWIVDPSLNETNSGMPSMPTNALLESIWGNRPSSPPRQTRGLRELTR